ncbi:MAG TPA: helix-turn-helix domain-containing protein [Steroidobacteraceae bacterium]|jgi:DNA-binding IscR family transcriptional regulator
MPFTQQLISDALGLSLPHVNRTLRQLRNDDLLANRRGGGRAARPAEDLNDLK